MKLILIGVDCLRHVIQRQLVRQLSTLTDFRALFLFHVFLDLLLVIHVVKGLLLLDVRVPPDQLENAFGRHSWKPIIIIVGILILFATKIRRRRQI